LSLSAGSRATALEALDPAAALDPALGAGVGRVAIGAHVDDDLVPRRARDEAPPARGAADSRERELRVVVLQGNRLLREYAARSRNEILARRREVRNAPDAVPIPASRGKNRETCSRNWDIEGSTDRCRCRIRGNQLDCPWRASRT